MAAGRERRIKLELLSSETISPEGTHTQSELPDELWEQIISKLTLKDNLRASAVSKRFLSIATLVQKANKPPWLVICPESGDLYELYDPSKRKSYTLDLPELRGAIIFHSKDGWLLMFNLQILSLFLFYPYTRELIQFPELADLSFEDISVCFSAAPTSPECVVLSIHFIDFQTARICTCCPGETTWTNVTYHYTRELSPDPRDKMFFCNGLFYYFNGYYEAMGTYNPDESSWSVQDIPKHGDNSTPLFFIFEDYWEDVFMAEHDGEIFITDTSTDMNPVIYKLDLANHLLVEMETLGGMTLFISDLSSHVRTNLLGNVRNKVYIPKVQSDGERCISYSFDEGKYFPENQRHEWKNLDLSESVWIDGPDEDLSTVL